MLPHRSSRGRDRATWCYPRDPGGSVCRRIWDGLRQVGQAAWDVDSHPGMGSDVRGQSKATLPALPGAVAAWRCMCTIKTNGLFSVRKLPDLVCRERPVSAGRGQRRWRGGGFQSVLPPRKITRDEHLLAKDMECIRGQAQVPVTPRPFGAQPGSLAQLFHLVFTQHGILLCLP